MGGLIQNLTVARADRRLRRPIGTASGQLRVLPAVFACISCDDGTHAAGEAPLLPGDDCEGVARAMAGATDALRGRSPNEARESIAKIELPPAAWALDTALAVLEAVQGGCSLTETIVPHTVPALHGVRTNALVVGDTAAKVEAEVEGYRADGEHTMKLKVGQGSLADDLARVSAARAAGPELALRLDANGAWDEAEAIRRIRAFAPLRPEYVEQPVAASDVAALARVRARVSVAIAADESARDAAGARRVLDAAAADVLVLKPARLGAATVTQAIVSEARDRGVGVVLSSLYDEPASLRASFALAAALCLEGVHGLATAALLELSDPSLIPRAGRLEPAP